MDNYITQNVLKVTCLLVVVHVNLNVKMIKQMLVIIVLKNMYTEVKVVHWYVLLIRIHLMVYAMINVMIIIKVLDLFVGVVVLKIYNSVVYYVLMIILIV